MAWRIHENLAAGTMDNTVLGRVTGTMRFVGCAGEVTLDLAGNMEGELRGKRILISNPEADERNAALGKPGTYMQMFRTHQVGEVQSIERLADGLLHAAWHDEVNGRVVIELPANAWSPAD